MNPFALLEKGLEFANVPRHVGIYTLRSGQYGNGRGALIVDAEGGEPYGKLSVNLEDAACAEDQFWSKSSDATWAEAMMLRIGLFEMTTWQARAGHAADYGTLWQFKKNGAGTYLVEDPDLWREHAELVQAVRDRRKAEATVKALTAPASEQFERLQLGRWTEK